MANRRYLGILGSILLVTGFILSFFLWLPETEPDDEVALVRSEVVSSTLLSFAIPTSTPSSAPTTSAYRLVIPKIGVDMPIVVGEASEEKALARGAWQIPGTASPGNENGYGNIVIGGHRYLYTSGPRTFFKLDKLAPGDEVRIEWQGTVYTYEVEGSEVVPPTAVRILNPTTEERLTLFTCTPIFTTKNRLVITARRK